MLKTWIHRLWLGCTLVILCGCRCGAQGCQWGQQPLVRFQTVPAREYFGKCFGTGAANQRRITTDLCPDFIAHARYDQQARAALASFQAECAQSCSADFARGFEDGYLNVATGGDGVTPAVPPPKYWGSGQRDPVGNQWATEWFAGFSTGAQWAYRNNAGAYSKVPAMPHASLPPPQIPSWAQNQKGYPGGQYGNEHVPE